jgi:hypothetical protein
MKQGFPTTIPLWTHFGWENDYFYDRYLGLDKLWEIQKFELPTPLPLPSEIQLDNWDVVGLVPHFKEIRANFLGSEKTDLI